MGYLKFENENIFLERKNKIILTDYSMFFKFMKYLKGIEQGCLQVEYNDLKLTNKNTLLIDLSSISSLTSIFEIENKIVDEYVKYNFENFNFDIEDEKCLNNILKKYIYQMFEDMNDKEFEIDYIKLLKSYLNIFIKDSNDLIKMINTILNNNNLKEIIIIYKKNILKEFKLCEIETLTSNKVHLFEICDKESNIELNDNIIIFDKEITQIRVDDFCDLIINRSEIYKSENKEIYSYLIFKILFYSINRKEVDLMKKYNDEISELARILNEEFKFNLKDLQGYI